MNNLFPTIMNTHTPAALASIIVTGCASQPEPFIGPHGRPGYSINCRNDLANCYRTARRLCPRGFDTIGVTPNSTQIPGRTVLVGGQPIPAGSTIERHTIFLAIECDREPGHE